MCNRYRTPGKQAELDSRCGIVSSYPDDFTIPPPELFPDKPAYVEHKADGGRISDTMSWGFPHKMPGKRREKATGKSVLLDKKLTNVRNYTSPFCKSALAKPQRRCLVPFSASADVSGRLIDQEKGTRLTQMPFSFSCLGASQDSF